MEKEDYHNFLRIIKNHSTNQNAFIRFNYFNDHYNNYIYNFFGPTEDLYDFDIICNICLRRVSLACRPNFCHHIFCRPCLAEWSKLSNKCPICRALFEYIVKVDYSENWVKLKYS